MQPKTRLLLVVAVVLAGGVAAFFALGKQREPLPAPPVVASEPAGQAQPAAAGVEAREAAQTKPASAGREAVASGTPELEIDPAIRAAMCGFEGRVVDHTGAPVAEHPLELVRFGADSMFGAPSAQAEEGVIDVEVTAGSAVTGENGRFRITGVWPQAFYALLVGPPGATSQFVVIDQTPGPGEIVDLGDIRIDETATITGTVVDDAGRPLAGALVRAADLPGTLTSMVPLERLDPDGAVILYDGQMRRVFEFPSWARRMFERLPIPRARSGEDGSFRLEGVLPGNNMLAATMPGHLSHIVPRLRLEAGEEEDVGEIDLREGDEVRGRVVDAAGRPVEGAEVIVGQAGGIGPIAFASRAEPTTAKGAFSLTGFRGGRVVAAARRRAGDPWIIADPQPAASDLLLTLPGAFELGVRVIGPDGAPLEGVRFRLIPDAGRQEMAAVARFGFLPATPLDDRLDDVGEGRWVFRDLPAGSYRLEASAPGFEIASDTVEVLANLERTLKLEPMSTATVVVVDEGEAPVRNAAVYAQHEDATDEIPRFCGRTDARGRFALQHTAAGPVKVAVHHPAFGWVAEKAQLPAGEVVVVMRAPGGVHGVLTEDGEPPAAGAYMVVVMSRSGSGGDQPMLPSLAAPDGRGHFHVRGLQPGTHHAAAVPSVRAVRSLGSIFELAQQTMLFGREGESADFEVRANAVAEITLDVSTRPEEVDGPAARLTGTVLVDGRPGTGMAVRTWASGRRAAIVDEAGRFDLGRLPAGQMQLELYDTEDSSAVFSRPLLQRHVQLEADHDLDVTIDLQTGALAGRIRAPDGAPAGRCEVELSGAPLSTEQQSPSFVHKRVASDDAGVFRFDRVPAGVYEATAESQAGRGRIESVRVVAGAPAENIEIRLQRTYTVSGRVDMSVFGEQKPRWMWGQLHPVDGESGNESRGMGIDEDTGTFSVDKLASGRYRAEINAFFPSNAEGEERWEGAQKQFVHEGTIEVTGRDLSGVVLKLVPKVEKQAESSRGVVAPAETRGGQ